MSLKKKNNYQIKKYISFGIENPLQLCCNQSTNDYSNKQCCTAILVESQEKFKDALVQQVLEYD